MVTPISIPSKTWEDHKAEILRLYVDESYPLKLVMKRLRTDEFDPTESQYRTKLKKWKRRKPRNTRLRRQRSSGTRETSPSRPHGDELSLSTNLVASALVQDLHTTAYTDHTLTAPYSGEMDPSVLSVTRESFLSRGIPESYRLSQPEFILPKPPPVRWPSHTNSLTASEHQWTLVPNDMNLSADENSQSLRVASAWRRASQAGLGQTRVLRQPRLRENTSQGEKQGPTTRTGCRNKVPSNTISPQDELSLACPDYNSNTHALDHEHQLEDHSLSILDGSARGQQLGYQPISGDHIQGRQTGHDPLPISAFGGPQAAAYFVPEPYEMWPWGASPEM